MISGSARNASLNAVLLRALQSCAPPDQELLFSTRVDALPIFNPDLEGTTMPEVVRQFSVEIDTADGVIIACPEYARGVPGGLKNAVDWMVSRQELISKPIALAHASYRGDDMLSALRLVLNTVTDRFAERVFLRIPLQSTSPPSLNTILQNQQNCEKIEQFLSDFRHYINAA